VGVSAEALHGRRERLRVGALVRLADLLVLRDPAAAHVLSAAGAPGPFRVGADPAWVALEGAPAGRAERDGVLVVLDARAAEQRPAELAAALDMIAARGLRVRLAPWRVSHYGADDIDLARSVAARLGARARVLLPPADMREAAEEAARAQVVVTMRLHGLIVAAGVATPTVVLDARPEARDLARRLGQRHLAADVPPEAVAAAVLDVAGGPGPDPAAIRAEQTAARESFRLVRLLLDGGRSDEDHEVSALPLEPAPFAQRRPGSEVRA
jgi:polysaccharide pyruvyl transferase WcaK-like protein